MSIQIESLVINILYNKKSFLGLFFLLIIFILGLEKITSMNYFIKNETSLKKVIVQHNTKKIELKLVYSKVIERRKAVVLAVCLLLVIIDNIVTIKGLSYASKHIDIVVNDYAIVYAFVYVLMYPILLYLCSLLMLRLFEIENQEIENDVVHVINYALPSEKAVTFLSDDLIGEEENLLYSN